MGITSWSAIGEMAAGTVDEVAGWFGGEGEVVNIAGQAVEATEDSWWVAPLKQAMPQIMQLTGKKTGASRATGAMTSAKPVSGNATSAMEVPKMIGKSANNNPLDELNKWSNLF